MMAKKDIDKEIAEAEAKIDASSKPKTDDDFEKVLLEIPISADNEDDWICIINGHSYQIQRGKQVPVPKCVKKIYENEQRQIRESRERSRKLQNAAAEKGDRLAFN